MKGVGLAGVRAWWSLWKGYRDEPSSQRLRRDLDALGIHLEVLHTSGHASVEDLRHLSSGEVRHLRVCDVDLAGRKLWVRGDEPAGPAGPTAAQPRRRWGFTIDAPSAGSRRVRLWQMPQLALARKWWVLA